MQHYSLMTVFTFLDIVTILRLWISHVKISMVITLNYKEVIMWSIFSQTRFKVGILSECSINLCQVNHQDYPDFYYPVSPAAHEKLWTIFLL